MFKSFGAIIIGIIGWKIAECFKESEKGIRFTLKALTAIIVVAICLI